MSGIVIRRTAIVANPPDGLHMRPATAFARLARGFRCTVTVRNGDRAADGRSPHELLMLLAPPGTELVIEVTGDDAADAVEQLLAVITAAGDEGA